MNEKNLLHEIEDIFVAELGRGSVFVIEQKLDELGLSPKQLSREGANLLVKQLIEEYYKVLGNRVNMLEFELKKKVFC
jgi:hypothetical protein